MNPSMLCLDNNQFIFWLTFRFNNIWRTESILAKCRGYGTIVSYNVPPYGRAGLYLELANFKELVDKYQSNTSEDKELGQTIYGLAQRSGMVNDVPLLLDPSNKSSAVTESDLPDSVFESGVFRDWMLQLSDYLNILKDRLFSSGRKKERIRNVAQKRFLKISLQY
jgi:magnesium chelatase subunit H